MPVEAYQGRPESGCGRITVCRFALDKALGGLIAVAHMADPCAEVAPVPFAQGTVLLVRWENTDQAAGPEFETVQAGDYLAYSSEGGFLFDTDDANLRDFYDKVP